MYGQSLIKKRKYWPKWVPGDQIGKWFEGKPLGFSKTLKQDIDGIPFYVHCSRDTRFVTKMMSTHGLLTPNPEHKTWRQNQNNQWVNFLYPEFLSRHNHSKHWVDDVNNRRHDPIGLEQVWHTKWWPTRQFTFICSVAESNAANCRARATKEATTPQLQFRQKLAQQMPMNRINDDGVRGESPLRVRKRGRDDRVLDHGLVARPNVTGGWSNSLNSRTRVNTMYAKTKCATCKTNLFVMGTTWWPCTTPIS
ncbi:hypothetical protein ACHAWO_012771 [Cyclotella atomus]|uniref:Uncharacterized protein n=1 Tax=Cyclotella atomus TaxID=382360 RepID=A0ABD3P9R6_9STRA